MSAVSAMQSYMEITGSGNAQMINDSEMDSPVADFAAEPKDYGDALRTQMDGHPDPVANEPGQPAAAFTPKPER